MKDADMRRRGGLNQESQGLIREATGGCARTNSADREWATLLAHPLHRLLLAALACNAEEFSSDTGRVRHPASTKSPRENSLLTSNKEQQPWP